MVLGSSPQEATCPACASITMPLKLVIESAIRLRLCKRCGTESLSQEFHSKKEERNTASEYWKDDFKFQLYADPVVQEEYERRYEDLLLWASSVSPMESFSTVLDVGCGTGNFLNYMQNRKKKAFGVDINERALELCKQRGLNVGNISHLDDLFADNTADLVTLWDVVEHDDDPVKLLSSAVFKLKPGGYLLMETPNASYLPRRIIRNIYSFTNGTINLTRSMYYWEHKVYFTADGLRLIIDSVNCQTIAIARRTSPLTKMKYYFNYDARTRGRPGAKLLASTWPVLEYVARHARFGNTLVALARRL